MIDPTDSDQGVSSGLYSSDLTDLQNPGFHGALEGGNV